ncbi:all trans-polyprenyl-diphosphate synthase PDSS2 isoform X1 [Hydra vulgaris]|uniref:All trans-polyprenyl-diphosphate synthase PDSS2 isoform X1 n=1 Tax=Hydra vulgaris TaxID=6087 RepID=A0ABM4D795_HYDVU
MKYIFRVTRTLNYTTLHKLKQNYSWMPSSYGLKRALTNAERLVGYPPAFNSLKYLVDEEPADILSIAKKLVGSGHPLLSFARDMLSPSRDINLRLGGLWVLLISRAAGESSAMIKEEFVNGIHLKQRILAETCEMINIAFLVHGCIINLDKLQYLETLNTKSLEFGNKLSVLGGDFLLAKASVELAKLSNTYVVELISQAIGDSAEGNVLDDFCAEQICKWSVEEWEVHTFQTRGSLLANSCKSALVLVGHQERHMDAAFEFGRYLSVAVQCAEDVRAFQNSKSILKPTNIIIVLALLQNEKTKIYYNSYIKNMNIASSNELKENIASLCEGIADKAKSLSGNYAKQCIDIIQAFQHKDSIRAIEDILSTYIIIDD